MPTHYNHQYNTDLCNCTTSKTISKVIRFTTPTSTVGTSIALCNSYTLEMGKMSRNHFEASELIPVLCAKPNPEQKPNWRY